MRQIPQSRCSAAGEGSAAELLRGDARRQDLLLLDVHKTCTPMLTLLHSSVAGVSVGAPAWDCLVVHFLAREFSGLELSFKLCGWQRKLPFNDVWEERGADKGGYSSTRGDVWRTSACTHTPRLMGPGLSASSCLFTGGVTYLPLPHTIAIHVRAGLCWVKSQPVGSG